MKPELAERLFVEKLFSDSVEDKKVEPLEGLEVEKLTGDASTRRYYRITGKDQSYVVCLANPLDSSQEMSPFMEVQGILEKGGVRVPRIYDYDPSKGYFLEEDLGDETLLKNLSKCDGKECELSTYRNVIDLLIKVHSISEEDLLNKPCADLAFDFDKLFYEVEFTKKYFYKEFLGHELSSEQVKELSKGFTFVCEELAKQKRVLTHRDFHTRNIMVKGGENIVIDFQDARMGIPQYDLVSMLEDAYYRIESSNKFELKKHYFNEFFKRVNPEGSFDHFLYHYDLMATQRIYKAIGSFAYIYATRGDQRYVKYIGYCFENLRLILSKHDELKNLRHTLAQIYYEY